MQPKSFTGRCSGLETKSNCAAAMRRGEQLEVKQRPARKKLDSANDIGEPADKGRSLNPPRSGDPRHAANTSGERGCRGWLEAGRWEVRVT